MAAIVDQSVAGRLRLFSFFVWMAVACAGVAFLGFLPTYWMPLGAGAFSAKPVVHLHGVVLFGWVLFFLAQAGLGAARRLGTHRALGVVGVSLATLITILSILVTLGFLRRQAALGFEEGAKTLSIVPLTDVVAFATLFAVAIGNVRRPQTHKRLMLLATVCLLGAPVARWFLVLLAPPTPEASLIPALLAALIADALIGVAIFHDWRTRERPHAAYVLGGGALVAMQLLRHAVAASPAWHAVVDGILSLAA